MSLQKIKTLAIARVIYNYTFVDSYSHISPPGLKPPAEQVKL